MTMNEVAAVLQIDRRTVSRMIKRGEIPGVLRATKPIRISRAVFERWVQGGDPEPPPIEVAARAPPQPPHPRPRRCEPDKPTKTKPLDNDRRGASSVHKLKRRGRVEWRARVTRNGITRTAIRRRRDEAIEAEQELIDQFEGRALKTDGPTFAQHWAEYMRDVASTTNKPSTLREKHSAYRVHLEPVFGMHLLREIDSRAVDRFRADLLTRRSPKTTNNVLTILRRSLVIAARWKRIEAVPHVGWARTVQPPIRFLSFDEAAALLASAGDALAMITLALHTGLRVGELRALEWSAVDLVAGCINVHRAASRTEIDTPKSNRSRVIPLSRTARSALAEHSTDRTGFVFTNRHGGMLTRHQADRILRDAFAATDLERLGWHALRHTFASHLVMRGVPLKAIQELLGHSTIDMTMRYAHLSPSVCHDAVERLDAKKERNEAGVVRAATLRSQSTAWL